MQATEETENDSAKNLYVKAIEANQEANSLDVDVSATFMNNIRQQRNWESERNSATSVRINVGFLTAWIKGSEIQNIICWKKLYKKKAKLYPD